MAKDDKKYVVNWPLSGHRGKDFAAGDIVPMSDEDAAPLLACGVLTVEGEQGDVEGEVVQDADDGAGE